MCRHANVVSYTSTTPNSSSTWKYEKCGDGKMIFPERVAEGERVAKMRLIATTNYLIISFMPKVPKNHSEMEEILSERESSRTSLFRTENETKTLKKRCSQGLIALWRISVKNKCPRRYLKNGQQANKASLLMAACRTNFFTFLHPNVLWFMKVVTPVVESYNRGSVFLSRD